MKPHLQQTILQTSCFLLSSLITYQYFQNFKYLKVILYQSKQIKLLSGFDNSTLCKENCYLRQSEQKPAGFLCYICLYCCFIQLYIWEVNFSSIGKISLDRKKTKIKKSWENKPGNVEKVALPLHSHDTPVTKVLSQHFTLFYSHKRTWDVRRKSSTF